MPFSSFLTDLLMSNSDLYGYGLKKNNHNLNSIISSVTSTSSNTNLHAADSNWILDSAGFSIDHSASLSPGQSGLNALATSFAESSIGMRTAGSKSLTTSSESRTSELTSIDSEAYNAFLPSISTVSSSNRLIKDSLYHNHNDSSYHYHSNTINHNHTNHKKSSFILARESSDVSENRAAPPRDNSSGGDPPDDPPCRDCTVPHIDHQCEPKTYAVGEGKGARLTRYAHEKNEFYKNLGIFQSGVILGLVGSVVYWVRCYALRPRLRNQWGEVADDWAGGDSRI